MRFERTKAKARIERLTDGNVHDDVKSAIEGRRIRPASPRIVNALQVVELPAFPERLIEFNAKDTVVV